MSGSTFGLPSAILASALISLSPLRIATLTDDTLDIHRNVEYARPDGQSLLLDLYVPKDPGHPVPVVLWIHGGGWEAGSRDTPMVLPMALLGFALVSIDYRLSQQAIFPAQIYDCKAAVRWVRAHAAAYNLNPNGIAAAGVSAGGHLAALLGTTGDDPRLEGHEGTTGVSSRVQAVVDYFGPTDFLTIGHDASPDLVGNPNNPVVALLGGQRAKDLNLARLASPVFHVSEKACPFFIVHGDQDPIVPLSQSIELNNALKKAGVSSELTVVRGGRHGFDDPASFAAAVAFLRRELP